MNTITQNNELSSSELKIQSSSLFSDILASNNRRVILACLIILAVANVSAVAFKASGKGSDRLTWESIIIEVSACLFMLGFSFFLSKRVKGNMGGYIVVTGVTMTLWVFQYIFHGATEAFAVNYIVLSLCVFYFDSKLSIYTLFLIILSQASLFIIRPELIPGGPPSNIAVRFMIYISVAIGVYFGAIAVRELFKIALKNEEEAKESLTELKQIISSCIESVTVLRSEIIQQNSASHNLDEISQHQAASLEEITSALEELAANSESINLTAVNLFAESDTIVDSISKLRQSSRDVVKSSEKISATLMTISANSESSTENIMRTMDNFKTLNSKSNEMSGFIALINDIADKVNLLSLNAAIEAARAGDQGRGFAVVADEISKLADQTSDNSRAIEKIIKETRQIIIENSNAIESSSVDMKELNSSIEVIENEICEEEKLIRNIDSAILDLAPLNEKINQSSKIIETYTGEQKIATHESSRTAADIAGKATELVSMSAAMSEASSRLEKITEDLEKQTEKITQS